MEMKGVLQSVTFRFQNFSVSNLKFSKGLQLKK